jgi:2-phosphosulfolactate phosphatase
MIYTHFLPPATGAFGAHEIAVVADILRATSVMSVALHAGVSEIYPCLEVDEAKSLAATIPGALLCGERQGIMPEGFDLGNSPGDYTVELCLGRPMVMTTTNGTRALMACSSAKTVYTLSFGIIAKVFDALKSLDQPIHLVGSGTDGQISWEDSLACGMLAHALIQSGHEPGNDATRIAISLYQNELGWLNVRSVGYQPQLVGVLKRGRGGQRVCEIGLEKDIVEVARLNDFDILTHVIPNPCRVVQSNMV